MVKLIWIFIRTCSHRMYSNMLLKTDVTTNAGDEPAVFDRDDFPF